MVFKRMFAVLLLWGIGLSGSAYSADNALAFIDKSLSPRAAAMGMSIVSHPGLSDSTYWNPAGLARLDSLKIQRFKPKIPELQIMASKAFETQFIGIQAASRIFGMNMGFNVMNAKVDGIPEAVKDSVTSRNTGTGRNLSYDATAVYIGSGMALTDELSFGLSGKIISETAADYSAFGVGVDAGLIYSLASNLSAGIQIQNVIQPEMKWNTPSKNAEKAPQRLVVGLGTKFNLGQTQAEAIKSKKPRVKDLLTHIAIKMQKGRKAQLLAGTEFWPDEHLALRAGYEGSNLTLGTGLVLGDLGIDFSWVSPSEDEIEDVYRLSIKFAI